MKCRHCHHHLSHDFLDLGFAPPSNAYLTAEDLQRPEKFYPLKVKVCELCWLVQTEDYAQADELFNADYAYFSSTSKLWLAHAKAYTDHITPLLGLNAHSLVMEVASNDGYLLKNFMAAGISCLGIEPTASTALAAEQLGIPVMREFFGQKLAQELAAQGRQADLIIGNNVYAHVPDINDFTLGMQAALKPGGTITLEFPHLMELLKHNQFDTVYHEHFSYLSLGAVSRIFKAAGLRIWQVEQLSTHGGSLRVYGCHEKSERAQDASVAQMLAQEQAQGLENLATYQAFQTRADKVKNDLLVFLIEQKRAGKTVAAYGAAAKGNTLLNYAGVKPDLLPYVCDAAAAKQHKFMPASHIPIVPPEYMHTHQPDFVLILPWNIASEVRHQLADLRQLGVRFVTAVPDLHIDPAN
jgi:hypothetical protein